MSSSSSIPHVVAVPLPEPGHILPLMELCLSLVKHGVRITFVNTELNHKRMKKAWTRKLDDDHLFHLVSVQDGLESHDGRRTPGDLCDSVYGSFATNLEKLIEDINAGVGTGTATGISCVVADPAMATAIELAAKRGIRTAIFNPTAAITMTLVYNIPKLIAAGIINDDGTLAKREKIQLQPDMPGIDSGNLVWVRMPDLTTRKDLFRLIEKSNKTLKMADRLMVNSAYELEPAVFDAPPGVIPIGPLVASNPLGDSAGNVLPEDSTCLQWLDQHPPRSVIYVAFGSTRVFHKTQFQELALGLELSNAPFLWVVPPDCIKNDGDEDDAYPEGFLDRVARRGKIVGWAPQRKVLSHPSVACFFNHGGWNSILEGASNGVPFLCWPYITDQFSNASYICDVWKVGLQLLNDLDETMTISREDVRKRVEQVLGDEGLQSRALHLKEVILKSVREGGSSYNNFQRFVEWVHMQVQVQVQVKGG